VTEPSILIAEEGGKSLVRDRLRIVLPLPLSPRKMRTSLSRTLKETPRISTLSPTGDGAETERFAASRRWCLSGVLFMVIGLMIPKSRLKLKRLVRECILLTIARSIPIFAHEFPFFGPRKVPSMRPALRFVLTLLLSILLSGCGKKTEDGSGSLNRPAVVIAIAGDIDSFNPLFAEDITAGEVNDLLFPSLVSSAFDRNSGALTFGPLLARSWEYADRNRDIVFHLQPGARWTDGTPVTARDVQLTYELYGDPDVASVRQAAVENLRRTGGKLDVRKSVEVRDDSTVIFHFSRAYPGQLFDAGLPVLPAHILEKLARKDIRTDPVNRSPVGFGPFSLAKWAPLQEIVLQSNPGSVVPYPAKLSQLILRIIPDYRTRLSQLESGEVDLVSGVRPEDAEKLAGDARDIEIISTPGRDYDFLGWNNVEIDPRGGSSPAAIRPHRLFGSRNVRRALTMAINRDELVQAYLGKHGQAAFGGISPLFKWAYNDSLKPLPFDPQGSRQLLEREGWLDAGGDGVLVRNKVRFSFVLKVPAGDQLRTVVAAAVQQQLRQVKIEVKIEQVERATFWQEVAARKYDAWLAGFSVPLQMQLDDLWGSDLTKYPFNLTGFRDARIDRILAAARTLKAETDGAPLWKEFQEIVGEEQPCTFLYWINSIVAVNRRVHGTHIGVLGTMHRAWEWDVGVAGRAGPTTSR
jgi:peptide/nickel transport system substrate-binding protein